MEMEFAVIWFFSLVVLGNELNEKDQAITELQTEQAYLKHDIDGLFLKVQSQDNMIIRIGTAAAINHANINYDRRVINSKIEALIAEALTED
tara:strand:- start:149 stop:424 length:276 start_codon:yes stop_codon:yes gene_type:complete